MSPSTLKDKILFPVLATLISVLTVGLITSFYFFLWPKGEQVLIFVTEVKYPELAGQDSATRDGVKIGDEVSFIAKDTRILEVINFGKKIAEDLEIDFGSPVNFVVKDNILINTDTRDIKVDSLKPHNGFILALFDDGNTVNPQILAQTKNGLVTVYTHGAAIAFILENKNMLAIISVILLIIILFSIILKRKKQKITPFKSIQEG